ncbi:MAG: PHP domain-containing protein [Lentisphaeria bacterium]|nr:PHP domain-containing protein [Lentisphaeria bacterium]
MLAICHTHYSLRAGTGSPRQWAEAAAAHGYSALAIADVDGLHGAVEFQLAAEAAGIRGIVGASLTLDGDASCVVLAPDDEGYRQLCRLLSSRRLSPRFDFRAAAEEGGVDRLLFLARGSAAPRVLAGLVPGENLFALMPETAGLRQPLLWERPLAGVRPAFVPEAWLIGEEDRFALSCLKKLRRLSGEEGGVPAPGPGEAPLPGAEEWTKRFPDRKAADAILERCTFRYPFGRRFLPRFDPPGGGSAVAHLEQLCLGAVGERYPPEMRQAAEERLRRELAVIDANGFADYFLVVHEIAEFCRRRGIAAAARGSAAASIVTYLLGIGDCCPIARDLYFERFMNPGRKDLPDIDLDIADNRRDEAVRFCSERWGEDRVAMLPVVHFYRRSSAQRDAARLLGLPSGLTGAPEGHRGAAELRRVAGCLLGHPRHLGVHGAGVLVCPGPVTDFAPLFAAPGGARVVHYEKDQAEAVGLVKLDLLGNSALSAVAEARASLSGTGRELADPGPPLDWKVNRLLADGELLGIFQCESPAMRRLCRAVGPRSRAELAMVLALVRPGPSAAGMKDTFLRRRRGIEPTVHAHPAMAAFLGDTHGVMLYQEDAMRTAVLLAGYTPGEADTLRRTLSGDHGAAALEEERERFLAGAARTCGLAPGQAGEVWEEMVRFAGYSFCKAHASAYALLAWNEARLKVHRPREFFASCLNRQQSMYPARVHVWDARRRGVPVHGPDVLESMAEWTAGPRGLRAGLGVVRGIAAGTVAALLAERARAPFAGLADLMRRVPFRRGEAERLVLAGACSAWDGRRELLAELDELDASGRIQPRLVVGGIPEPPSLLRSQLDLTGIPFAGHPAELAGGKGLVPARDLAEHTETVVEMVGILDATKVLRVPARDSGEARTMGFAAFEDATGLFDVFLAPEVHARLGQLFQSIGPYRLRGRVACQWGVPSLELEDAERLDLPE